MKYWVMKSEPDVFSIDDLERVGKEPWNGVRNFQARNYMRDEMRSRDRVLFYHSNAKVLGVVGLARVASRPYPDPTQFDPEDEYFDPSSKVDDPRWVLVDVEYERKFARPVTLEEIQSHRQLSDMLLARKRNRLSITPATKVHFDTIVKLGTGVAKPLSENRGRRPR